MASICVINAFGIAGDPLIYIGWVSISLIGIGLVITWGYSIYGIWNMRKKSSQTKNSTVSIGQSPNRPNAAPNQSNPNQPQPQSNPAQTQSNPTQTQAQPQPNPNLTESNLKPIQTQPNQINQPHQANHPNEAQNQPN